MISPNHEPSEFEHPEDITRLEELESRLRLLPLRDASNRLDGRLESLFSSSHSSRSAADDASSDRATLTVSTSDGNARRGIVLIATCLSSIVAVLTFAVVTSFSTSDKLTSSVASVRDAENRLVDEGDDSAGSIASIPRITKPSQSESSITSLLAVGSQIVESERAFARSLAVAWEQQTGATFHAMEHVRDRRFSECRRCHRHLSSAWHNEAAFQPDVAVCLNCHQVGG